MKQEETITVVVADDHELIRNGFVYSAKKIGGFQLLATAADGEELLERVREHRPQVVIADIKMPKVDGVKATAIIKREFPQIQVMALTAYNETYLIKDMMEAGATGFALKNTGPLELLEGMRKMLQGQQFSCNETALNMMKLEEPPKSPVDFTPRELEVIQWICVGSTNRQISRQMDISVRTVETHRANIYKKMGVKTAMGVAVFARKYGLF